MVALQNTGYFRVVANGVSESQADELLARRRAVHAGAAAGLRATCGVAAAVLYMAVDATDPVAAGNALAALNQVGSQVLARELAGPWRQAQQAPPPFELRVHKRYNPEGLSRLNIVPGLMEKHHPDHDPW